MNAKYSVAAMQKAVSIPGAAWSRFQGDNEASSRLIYCHFDTIAGKMQLKSFASSSSTFKLISSQRVSYSIAFADQVSSREGRGTI